MRHSSSLRSLVSVICLLLSNACGGGSGGLNPTGSGQAGAGGSGGSASPSGAAGDSGTAGAGGSDQQTGTAGDGAPGTAGGGAAGVDGAAGAAAGAAGTGAAGTGAAGAGTAGTTGGAGGGAAGAGAHASGQSTGCNKANTDSPTKWVEHDVMVTVAAAYAPAFEMRKYFTMMPHNYDPTKAYPVTMWGPGCGASGAESNQLQGSGATDDYIQVFLLQKDSCFSTSAADSPEVPYFDTTLAGVEAGYCVDKAQVFVAGYSSGSWLTHLLGCQRGNVIRGIGSASGGILVDHGTCTGPIAAIMTGDSSDTTNPIISVDTKTGTPKGSGAARDRILMANGCQMTSKPWDPAFPGCDLYDGCGAGYPVVWCLTMGQGHSSGGNNSAKGFWKFWSTLPKLP
jgi:poly(3-hydroxybutyrate) depolymerase